MKHYKDENGQVYAYEEDGSQDDIIPQNLVAISDAEAELLRAPALVTPSAVYALQGLKAIDHFGFASAYDAWASDPSRTFLERAFINKAQTWERGDSTLTAAALALGITEAQLDAMFTWAAS